jgi:hypothetical protein
VSPAHELNTLAKLMAKFVNSVNKRNPWSTVDLREASQAEGQEPKTNGQGALDKEVKKSEGAGEGTKKKANPKVEPKEEGQQKTR